MEEYKIKVELLTDTVFGSGYSVPGFIDADVLYDEYGFPYINGKTFKGKLGEMAGVFVNMVKASDKGKEIGEILEEKKDKLFGVGGEYRHDKVKFSDCEISKEVRDYFKNNMGDSNIKPGEILDALTHVEEQTSIDRKTGVARDKSLRNYRVINRGFILYSHIHCPENLDEYEKILLASACSLLRHLGAYETKGKGLVEVSMYKNDKNVTFDYINLLREKVNLNV